MRYLSVCSGIEAASVAWEPLGWEPVAFSEIDPFACAVLAQRFPGVHNLGSLENYEEWQIEPGSVDVLVGGTPCQSFSVAGLRGGIEDARGNLALVFARLAHRIRPRYVVWENVPGALSSNGGRDFGSIVGALVECGYGIAWRVLDAQFFGVPQRRRRVFLVGHLGSKTRAAEVLFEPSSLSRATCENGQGFGGMDARSRCYSVTPLSGQGSRLQTVAVDVASGLTSVSLGESTERGIRVLEQPAHAVECDLDFDCCCGAAASRIRRLTPREVERCFGFHDDYTRIQWEPESRLDAARFRALGNSMAVPVVRWIGQRIADVDRSR